MCAISGTVLERHRGTALVRRNFELSPFLLGLFPGLLVPGLLPHDLEGWSQALGLPTGIGLRVVREFVKICDYARLVRAMCDDRVKKFDL